MLGGTDTVVVVHTFGRGAVNACFFAGVAVRTAAIMAACLFEAVAAGAGIKVTAFFRIDLDGAFFAATFLIVGACVCAACDFGHLIHSFL